MPEPITPPEWVQPGAEVVVIVSERFGVGTVAAFPATIAKVGKLHTTVTGVHTGGSTRPDTPLVKFSNRGLRTSSEPRKELVPADSEQARKALDQVRTTQAYDRVQRSWEAFHALARDRRNPYPEKRPDPAKVDDALAAAAIALRGVLGVPDGTTEEN